MPKNNKLSSGNNSLARPLQTIITIVIIILAIGYFVYNSDTNQVNNPQPVPVVQGVTTSTPSVETQNNESVANFDVFFTAPVHPFAGNTKNSIEYRLIEKIDKAKVSLHGAFYEFNLESVAQALINAHNRGVEVQIVYDDKQVGDDPQIKELQKIGIKTVPDKRSVFMHNKFVVVDNQCVWTGSFNITENAAYRNNENAAYICDPKLAKNYSTEFNEMFNGHFGPKSSSDTPYPVLTINGFQIENYFAPEDGVMDKVIAAVNMAKTSIHFLAFSLTDKNLADAMLARQNSGASISGVFETRSASADSSECANLLKKGADIHIDGNPDTMHEKVIIIDSSTVIFGSFNYSAQANEDNDENLLIVHSPQIALMFEKEFQKILAESITPTSTCKSP